MHYKQLGTSELRLSTVGFGAMSLGTEAEQASQLIARALQRGITYFDTADLYDHGLNEELVGRALGAHRRDVVLATKVGNQWRADGSGWDWNPRRDYILSSVEESLRRLGTGYIDLYLLHGGTLQDPIDETISAFERLVQQGKIRYYGISSIRPNVIRQWVSHARPAAVMTQYSLLDRRPEESVLPLLHQKGIGVLARGALAQGLLAGKAARDYLGYEAAEVHSAAEAVALLSGPQRTAAQTALQFVWQQEAITSAVVGVRTAEQLEDAVGACSAPPLSAEEVERLRTALPANHYTEHR